MIERTAASSVLLRVSALIVALAMVAFAGEKTPSLASSSAAYPILDYKILNLGTLHEDPLCSGFECYSKANDVNSWGQVVGESLGSSICPDCFYGFRTSPNQPITPADLLYRLDGDLGSVALGLNDDGVAVGYSWPGNQAVRWVGTQPSSLDPIMPPWSLAHAINDMGVPAGGHSSGGSGERAWAYLTSWSLNAFFGRARDFNNHGVMVGYAHVPCRTGPG